MVTVVVAVSVIVSFQLATVIAAVVAIVTCVCFNLGCSIKADCTIMVPTCCADCSIKVQL